MNRFQPRLPGQKGSERLRSRRIQEPAGSCGEKKPAATAPGPSQETTGHCGASRDPARMEKIRREIKSGKYVSKERLKKAVKNLLDREKI